MADREIMRVEAYTSYSNDPRYEVCSGGACTGGLTAEEVVAHAVAVLNLVDTLIGRAVRKARIEQAYQEAVEAEKAASARRSKLAETLAALD